MMDIKIREKRIRDGIRRGLVSGGAFGLGLVLVLGVAMAFTEPTSGPTITEPADASSVGAIETAVGTPTAVTANTSTIFNYLRTIYTNIGMSPSSETANETDGGRLIDIVGTSATAANGVTIFNFLKAINDNLDFPEVANVRSSDTVKGSSGTIANCTDNNGGECYISQATKSALDADLAAGNIISGTTIFGVAGSIANCGTQGEQDCYATGSYYGATLETVENTAISQAAGYYAAFNLATVDTDLTANNVVCGRTIFGVAGSCTCYNPSMTLTNNQEINLTAWCQSQGCTSYFRRESSEPNEIRCNDAYSGKNFDGTDVTVVASTDGWCNEGGCAVNPWDPAAKCGAYAGHTYTCY